MQMMVGSDHYTFPRRLWNPITESIYALCYSIYRFCMRAWTALNVHTKRLRFYLLYVERIAARDSLNVLLEIN